MTTPRHGPGHQHGQYETGPHQQQPPAYFPQPAPPGRKGRAVKHVVGYPATAIVALVIGAPADRGRKPRRHRCRHRLVDHVGHVAGRERARGGARRCVTAGKARP